MPNYQKKKKIVFVFSYERQTIQIESSRKNSGKALCGRCYAAKLRVLLIFLGHPRALFGELILGLILGDLGSLG